MVLKLKFYQKRQNYEIWVLLRLPKKFKTTFQTRIEMKMNFLIALMTRLNWDLTWHEAKWFGRAKILKFGWLLKLPKISGNCPKVNCIDQMVKTTFWGLLLNQMGSNMTCLDPKGQSTFLKSKKRASCQKSGSETKKFEHEDCLEIWLKILTRDWPENQRYWPNSQSLEIAQKSMSALWGLLLNHSLEIDTKIGFESNRMDWKID